MALLGNIRNYGSKEDMASIENIGNVGNKAKTGWVHYALVKLLLLFSY